MGFVLLFLGEARLLCGSKEVALLMKKLPCEAYKFVGNNYSKSQLGIVRVCARFVLDSSRVCFTCALNL